MSAGIRGRLVGERFSELGFMISPSGAYWFHPRGLRLEAVPGGYCLSRPGSDVMVYLSSECANPGDLASEIGLKLLEEMRNI